MVGGLDAFVEARATDSPVGDAVQLALQGLDPQIAGYVGSPDLSGAGPPVPCSAVAA
jgi:hypothetical protein